MAALVSNMADRPIGSGTRSRLCCMLSREVYPSGGGVTITGTCDNLLESVLGDDLKVLTH